MIEKVDLTYMLKNTYNRFLKKRGYSLLELLVVLSIVGLMITIVIYGMVKFRQTMIISNATKEIALQLRKARRYAINNVVTKDGYSASGYYIEFRNDDYRWGECNTHSSCSSESIMSSQYKGISVTGCKSGTEEYTVVKFDHVTGEFNFMNNPGEVPLAGIPDSCIIEVSFEGLVDTTRQIEVDRESRTVKIL